MSNRANRIAVKGWVAVGFACLALVSPMVLNAMGFAKYESWRSDTERPADRGLWERLCLVSEAMMPACLLVWAASQFRVRNEILFQEAGQGGRIMPLAAGACGLALFVREWLRWGPYTGEYFGMFQGWRFALAWLLMWWGIVFLRLGKPAPASSSGS